MSEHLCWCNNCQHTTTFTRRETLWGFIKWLFGRDPWRCIVCGERPDKEDIWWQS